jgi:hypothetical protein
VGLIISFVAQEAKGHGVPEVIKAVAFRDCHLLFGSLKTLSRKVFERGLKERQVLDWQKNELTMTRNRNRKD